MNSIKKTMIITYILTILMSCSRNNHNNIVVLKESKCPDDFVVDYYDRKIVIRQGDDDYHFFLKDGQYYYSVDSTLFFTFKDTLVYHPKLFKGKNFISYSHYIGKGEYATELTDVTYGGVNEIIQDSYADIKEGAHHKCFFIYYYDKNFKITKICKMGGVTYEL